MMRAVECWSRPAAAGPRWELHQTSSPLIDRATACSIGLSLAEALDYLHRVQFRGGMSLSWDESVRAVRGGDGSWHVAVMPPTPAQVAMASTPCGFTGVARIGAPELLSAPGPSPPLHPTRSPWQPCSSSSSPASV